MVIKLYSNKSETFVVPKVLENEKSISGTLRDVTDVINPEIILQGAVNTFNNYNYFLIPKFKNRFYYITDLESISATLTRIKGHIDVLQTYQNEIKNMDCVIKRNENKFNLFLRDNELEVYSYPVVNTITFPNSMTHNSFVLTVAGQ